jgi:hypothetical protein
VTKLVGRGDQQVPAWEKLLHDVAVLPVRVRDCCADSPLPTAARQTLDPT